MSKELATFFADLSANPLLAEKFESDPAAIMDGFGLSDAEKQLVLTRDLESITDRLKAHSRVSGKKKKKATKKK